MSYGNKEEKIVACVGDTVHKRRVGRRHDHKHDDTGTLAFSGTTWSISGIFTN